MQAACQKQVTPHHLLKRLILICACKVRFSQRMLSSSIYVWVYLGFCPWSSSSWNHPKNPNIDQEIDGTDHMHTAKKNTHYDWHKPLKRLTSQMMWASTWEETPPQNHPNAYDLVLLYVLLFVFSLVAWYLGAISHRFFDNLEHTCEVTWKQVNVCW